MTCAWHRNKSNGSCLKVPWSGLDPGTNRKYHTSISICWSIGYPNPSSAKLSSTQTRRSKKKKIAHNQTCLQYQGQDKLWEASRLSGLDINPGTASVEKKPVNGRYALGNEKHCLPYYSEKQRGKVGALLRPDTSLLTPCLCPGLIPDITELWLKRVCLVLQAFSALITWWDFCFSNVGNDTFLPWFCGFIFIIVSCVQVCAFAQVCILEFRCPWRTEASVPSGTGGAGEFLSWAAYTLNLWVISLFLLLSFLLELE